MIKALHAGHKFTKWQPAKLHNYQFSIKARLYVGIPELNQFTSPVVSADVYQPNHT